MLEPAGKRAARGKENRREGSKKVHDTRERWHFSGLHPTFYRERSGERVSIDPPPRATSSSLDRRHQRGTDVQYHRGFPMKNSPRIREDSRKIRRNNYPYVLGYPKARLSRVVTPSKIPWRIPSIRSRGRSFSIALVDRQRANDDRRRISR